jgi:4-carboxymuconolactone decarboxylase
VQVSKSRLPLLGYKELDDAQQRLYYNIRSSRGDDVVYGEGWLRGPFNALLYQPLIGDPVQRLGDALRHKTTLTGRVRELAILETAVANGSEYEWTAHANAASREGLGEADIVAISTGGVAPNLTADETLTRQVIQRLISDRDLDGQFLEDAIRLLGYVGLVELVFLVGYYEMLARSLRIWRVSLAGIPDRENVVNIEAFKPGREA